MHVYRVRMSVAFKSHVAVKFPLLLLLLLLLMMLPLTIADITIIAALQQSPCTSIVACFLWDVIRPIMRHKAISVRAAAALPSRRAPLLLPHTPASPPREHAAACLWRASTMRRKMDEI